MIILLSGGSAIPETCLPAPTIMLSFFVNISQKTGKPDSRIRNLVEARKQWKKKCSKKK